MDRTINAVISHILHGGLQEVGELCLVHFARCHGKFAVLYLSRVSNMTINRHVGGGISKHHPGDLTVHQLVHNLAIECIATDKSMRPQLPDIPFFATAWNIDLDGIISRISSFFRRLIS